MPNEPKAMQEIHEIRLKNFEAEKDLTPTELAEKRNDDILRIKKTIAKYGLKTKAIV